MKKERATAVAATTGGGKPVRTTLFLTEASNFYLDLYALQTRRPKGELVREAVEAYLTSKGFQPEQMPRGKVSFRMEGA